MYSGVRREPQTPTGSEDRLEEEEELPHRDSALNTRSFPMPVPGLGTWLLKTRLPSNCRLFPAGWVGHELSEQTLLPPCCLLQTGQALPKTEHWWMLAFPPSNFSPKPIEHSAYLCRHAFSPVPAQDRTFYCLAFPNHDLNPWADVFLRLQDSRPWDSPKGWAGQEKTGRHP